MSKIGSLNDGTSKPIMGRPTKYKEEFCKIAHDHLSEGYSLASVSGKLGVSRDSLFEWAKVHPNFSDAVSMGRANGMLVWEDRLAKIAVDGSGNANATRFAMTNLYRDDWNDRVVSEMVGKNDGPIQTTEISAAERLKGMLDGVQERS